MGKATNVTMEMMVMMILLIEMRSDDCLLWTNLLFKCFLMMFLNCEQMSCFGLETLDLDMY